MVRIQQLSELEEVHAIVLIQKFVLPLLLNCWNIMILVRCLMTCLKIGNWLLYTSCWNPCCGRTKAPHPQHVERAHKRCKTKCWGKNLMNYLFFSFDFSHQFGKWEKFPAVKLWLVQDILHVSLHVSWTVLFLITFCYYFSGLQLYISKFV